MCGGICAIVHLEINQALYTSSPARVSTTNQCPLHADAAYKRTQPRHHETLGRNGAGRGLHVVSRGRPIRRWGTAVTE